MQVWIAREYLEHALKFTDRVDGDRAIDNLVYNAALQFGGFGQGALPDLTAFFLFFLFPRMLAFQFFGNCRFLFLKFALNGLAVL